MSEVRLLIVDSDATVRNIIKTQIASEDYVIDEAADGISAMKLFRRNNYSVIVLDTLLPELDGWNVCRQIRKVSDAPIIILSGSASEEDKLSFFDIGVDDYITKPFSPKELLARIKVALHRSGTENNLAHRKIIYDGLDIDIISRMVYVDNNCIFLTPREYSLLLFLSQNPLKAFSRDELLTKVWGEDYLGTDRTVDTHIKSLRESIKPYQDYIATVWGYGYIFKGGTT